MNAGRRRLLRNWFFRKLLTATQAAGDIQLFGAGKRDDGTLDKFDTNDRFGGQVPPDKDIPVVGLGFQIRPPEDAVTGANAILTLSAARFTLTVANYPVIDAEPVILWPAGCGFTVATTTAMFNQQIGTPDFRTMRRLPYPIQLSGQQYSMMLHIETALALTTGATLDLTAFLVVEEDEAVAA